MRVQQSFNELRTTPKLAWLKSIVLPSPYPCPTAGSLKLSCADPRNFPPGTMLFGESTTACSAATLLNQAAESGVNFFDTAEMYPVPQRAATQGRSEPILGSWLRSRRR